MKIIREQKEGYCRTYSTIDVKNKAISVTKFRGPPTFGRRAVRL